MELERCVGAEYEVAVAEVKCLLLGRMMRCVVVADALLEVAIGWMLV